MTKWKGFGLLIIGALHRASFLLFFTGRVNGMKRHLNDEESREAGYAVGTFIEVFKRLLNGDLDFTMAQYEQIAKSAETLEKFSEEEQFALIEFALKESEL
ncbi:MAG: hypothetical protein ABGX20_05630 [Bacillus sp. (in: firmicutes)]